MWHLRMSHGDAMHANARTIFRPRPLHGWSLESSCRLAAAYPSFLTHVVQCSPLKRHALAAGLAELDRHDPGRLAERLRRVACVDARSGDPLIEVARSLVATRAAAVLEAVFGSVPDGL